MQHVIDIGDAGTDASVLTDSGSGGLIGRGTLADGPLDDRIDDEETPRWVLRNKKRGFEVDRPDGTDEYSPDRNHTGVALVTDVRLLFAVGRSDGDRTASVSLPDVVDVRTEDGFLGDTFVVDTVADAQYRFPCRGDLEPVAEFVDAAVGIWTRAERRLERADEQVDRLREAFESGDTDVVLAATGDVAATLEDAQSEAAALDGAAKRVDARADAVRSTLADLERRAHAERAEQARERAHVRWDDHEFEAAFDHFDDAAAAYAAAVATDGDTPSDDLLSRRREALADERDRLAAAPLERADHAADVAATTDDPGATIDWWESAVERYETALSLDWGRDDRRFGGTRERIREDLALAARNLVEAHCALARDHIADGDDDRQSNPEAAGAAYNLAADALDAARTIARERAPDAMDAIDQVATDLEARRDEVPIPEGTSGAEVDGGQSPPADLSTARTVVDPESSDGTADAESTVSPSTTGEEDVTPSGANPSSRANFSPGAIDDPSPSSTADPSETTANPSETTTDSSETTAKSSGATGDSSSPVDGDATSATPSTDAEPDANGGTSSPRSASTTPRNSDPAKTDTTTDTADTAAETTDTTGATETATETTETRTNTTTETTTETHEPDRDASAGQHGPAGDGQSTAPDPSEFLTLVSDLFERSGWSTTVFESSTAQEYDILAVTGQPVSVAACVWTVHPDEMESVDAATVGDFVSYLARTDEADVAVVCSAAPLSPSAREKATDHNIKLLDRKALNEELADSSLERDAF